VGAGGGGAAPAAGRAPPPPPPPLATCRPPPLSPSCAPPSPPRTPPQHPAEHPRRRGRDDHERSATQAVWSIASQQPQRDAAERREHEGGSDHLRTPPAGAGVPSREGRRSGACFIADRCSNKRSFVIVTWRRIAPVLRYFSAYHGPEVILVCNRPAAARPAAAGRGPRAPLSPARERRGRRWPLLLAGGGRRGPGVSPRGAAWRRGGGAAGCLAGCFSREFRSIQAPILAIHPP
jgi:hypothetical protein